MQERWGLLDGGWNRKYSEVSPELGGGRSPKNAKGVRGRSWKDSEMSSERKTSHPLTSTPSDPNSTPTFFRDSPSRSGDRATPTASNIKGHIIKVIHNIKGQGWSGLVGNAGQWPWS